VSAARRLPASALPVRASESAVPWSTLVRRIGSPERDIDGVAESDVLDHG
jgi:hypothetical protein